MCWLRKKRSCKNGCRELLLDIDPIEQINKGSRLRSLICVRPEKNTDPAAHMSAKSVL
jgi:hypothetical protein